MPGSPCGHHWLVIHATAESGVFVNQTIDHCSWALYVAASLARKRRGSRSSCWSSTCSFSFFPESTHCNGFCFILILNSYLVFLWMYVMQKSQEHSHTAVVGSSSSLEIFAYLIENNWYRWYLSPEAGCRNFGTPGSPSKNYWLVIHAAAESGVLVDQAIN